MSRTFVRLSGRIAIDQRWLAAAAVIAAAVAALIFGDGHSLGMTYD
jgi:hypothetical protein